MGAVRFWPLSLLDADFDQHFHGWVPAVLDAPRQRRNRPVARAPARSRQLPVVSSIPPRSVCKYRRKKSIITFKYFESRSINQSINQTTEKPKNQSMNRAMNRPDVVNQSVNPSINRSKNKSTANKSINLSYATIETTWNRTEQWPKFVSCFPKRWTSPI